MRKSKDDGLEGTDSSDAEFFSARKPKKLQKEEQERARESKHLEAKLMKPPTALEAEFQSDVESDAEFRSWSEELQKELPANGGGGKETFQEEVFRLCREDAARFKDVEFFKADAASDRSLYHNTTAKDYSVKMSEASQ